MPGQKGRFMLQVAGPSLFPSAEFWIQREEIAFWTGPVARHDAYKMFASAPSLAALVRMSYANRVRAVDGETQVRTVQADRARGRADRLSVAGA
jgi:hypothetical protein